MTVSNFRFYWLTRLKLQILVSKYFPTVSAQCKDCFTEEEEKQDFLIYNVSPHEAGVTEDFAAVAGGSKKATVRILLTKLCREGIIPSGWYIIAKYICPDTSS